MCALFVFTLAFSTNANDEQNAVAVTNAVLNVADIPGLKTTNGRIITPWCDFTESGIITGLVQNVELNQVQLSVCYMEFPFVWMAVRTIEDNMKQMTHSYIRGLWEDANVESIGDAAWSSKDKTTVDLFVLVDKTIIWVRSYGANRADNIQAIETIALKIVEKIKQGGKVIIPEEPPPVAP